MQMSTQSDSIMSTVWVISLLIPILNIYALYKLIKRRNDHFHRQNLLTEDLLKFINTSAEAKGVKVELSPLERTLREGSYEEREKSAALWAILTLVTVLAGIYVYYFLMRDFHNHERREDSVWESISNYLSHIGVTFTLPVPLRRNFVPKRSFAIYIVLTIVTLGLFGLYWLYTLIKDPNEHFREHTIIESHLKNALTRISET